MIDREIFAFLYANVKMFQLIFGILLKYNILNTGVNYFYVSKMNSVADIIL